MSELSSRTCVPCRGGVPPLKGKELADVHKQLAEWAHWKVVDEHHITRAFTFPDFKQALDFVNRVGADLGKSRNHNVDPQNRWPY
jgi:4a-hydroxytetrahydrobiopterin dehydratase